MEYIETAIIGGGQAGLAASYYLSQERQEHIVLEQAAKPANVWRNERWDSFTLVTPTWTFKLPGINLSGESRDGFLPRTKIIDAFERYVRDNKLPVSFNTKVSSVKNDENGFTIETSSGYIKAKNVIIATGFWQQPVIPDYASKFSVDIKQIPSNKYRNPESLDPGGVLVVGSAQSGCQIAEELNKSGRNVYLCTGTAGRVPRRYRGKDILEWLDTIGFFNRTVEQLPPGTGRFHAIPHLSGTRGGHTINLHQFARDGVKLLGHIIGAENEKAFIASDLYNNLIQVDQFEAFTCNTLNEYIKANNIDAPEEDNEMLNDGFQQPITEVLDLKKENIKTIIWAKGYKFNYYLVRIPVFDAEGFPIQKNGVTDVPGLYFVGIPWMPVERTGILLGVAEGARNVTSNIIEKRNKRETMFA